MMKKKAADSPFLTNNKAADLRRRFKYRFYNDARRRWFWKGGTYLSD
jgi:hypothetical protein